MILMIGFSSIGMVFENFGSLGFLFGPFLTGLKRFKTQLRVMLQEHLVSRDDKLSPFICLNLD